jgi:hypothetical protein
VVNGEVLGDYLVVPIVRTVHRPGIGEIFQMSLDRPKGDLRDLGYLTWGPSRFPEPT